MNCYPTQPSVPLGAASRTGIAFIARIAFSIGAALTPLSMLAVLPAFAAQAAPASNAGPTVTAEFLLGDYFKPGRAVPVRLHIDLPNDYKEARFFLRADAAITTLLIVNRGRADAIVPWILYDDPADASWKFVSDSASLPRHPLPRHPMHQPAGPLVATVGLLASDIPFAALVGSAHPIVIERDESDPLPGPPEAWEALDALVIDRSRLPDAHVLSRWIEALLPGGTIIAVRGGDRPDPRWPWRQEGAFWVVRPAADLPAFLPYTQKPYASVHRQPTDWPAAFRWRIVLFAALSGLTLLLASLLRWRFRALAGVAASIVIALTLVWWWHRQTPVRQQGGAVLVLEPGLATSDSWAFQVTASKAEAETICAGLPHPIFSSSRHRRQTIMSLLCTEDGQPSAYIQTIPDNGWIAFLARTVGPQAPAMQPTPGTPDDLNQLAAFYLRNDEHPAGRLPATPIPRPTYQESPVWPTIVIDRRRGQ